MDLRLAPEDAAFRAEVRAFMRTDIPADIRARMAEGRHPTKQDIVTCQRILNARGWAVPHWPVAWGGQDWSPVRRLILQEEMQIAAVPNPLQFNVGMVGPVIARYGTEAQKRRFLPATANLDIWWCQGFSEPGAGSDLASLRTRADRRENGALVVNGQKAWTTLGQHADWIFCLVRTDREAKKQRGISFLLIDMTSPGITLRPVITIDGEHEVNEVFFDDVVVPAENLVGEENRGWDIAKFLLANERSGIARLGISKQRLMRARALAKTTEAHGATLWEDPHFRRRVAMLEVELKALEITQLRVACAPRADADAPDPASSILKLRGSELQQATAALLLEVAGPHAIMRRDADGTNAPGIGADWADAAARLHFNTRKVSVYGGSNEIQRNIIAKMVLGL